MQIRGNQPLGCSSFFSKLVVRVFVSLLMLTPLVAYADAASEAGQWFETEYAPLYASPKASTAGVLANYFVDPNWVIEPISGASLIPNSEEGWVEWVTANLEAGWEGSELVTFSSHELNSKAVHIKAQWIRRTVGEPDATSCFLYLAAKQANSWRFVSVVVIACAEL